MKTIQFNGEELVIPSIEPHCPTLKRKPSTHKDLPENSDCVIDVSPNAINYCHYDTKTQVVWIQTQRRISYDKHPRPMTTSEFDQWRKECQIAAQNDKAMGD